MAGSDAAGSLGKSAGEGHPLFLGEELVLKPPAWWAHYCGIATHVTFAPGGT